MDSYCPACLHLVPWLFTRAAQYYRILIILWSHREGRQRGRRKKERKRDECEVEGKEGGRKEERRKEPHHHHHHHTHTHTHEKGKILNQQVSERERRR